MTILITGATGLIGKEIVKLCHQRQIVVHYLSTSKRKLSTQDNYKGFYWNPRKAEIDIASLRGVDIIVNLAGATISKRWTPVHKREIIESRIKTVQLLKKTIKDHGFSVKQLVSASAIGIYPDSIINYYEETSTELSASFLGNVAAQWEAAVDEFENLGIKTAKIRIGLVLAKKGGALPKIATPIRLGAGAAFGSGKQWQSWIHIEDLATLFLYVIDHKLEGVYNGVAPNPVTNTELIKAIAKTLNKPLILPNIPRFAMQVVLGELHVLLFESQRVSSKKVEDLGFDFAYHHLDPALQDLLH